MKKALLIVILLSGFRLFGQVSPLLTTNWNQTCNYNDSCPEDPSGPCGNTLTGCNATAWAQIMKYHNHPAAGWGMNSYTPFEYPTQEVDFSSSTYNYGAMPSSASAANTEMAKLIYHTGVALNTSYSPTNSVASFNVSALQRYFKYSLEGQNRLKVSYSNSEWENLIITELNAGRPVPAGGGSHAFIIDGYQTSPTLRFHINFGWGGSYNGYYDIHNLIAAGTNFTPYVIGTGIRPLTDLEVNLDSITVSSNSQNVFYIISGYNAWTATSDQPWATPLIASAAGGYFDYATGNGCTVTTNNSYSPRFVTLTFTDGITNRNLVIRQNGITPSLYVNPDELTYAAAGGMQSITISTDSNWVVTSPDSWITFSAPGGNGDSTIDLSALPNPSAGTRIGTVLVTRGSLQQTVQITQGGSSSFWCIPIINTPHSNGITHVGLNTINRSSANDEGYIITNDTTTLKLDSAYTLSVTFAGGNAPGIWIDWNQDGDFNDVGEAVVSPSGTWYPTFSSTQNQLFTVPSNAMEGLTRMRVYAKSFGSGPVSSPCGISDNGGDIEDYHILVKDHRHITVSPASINVPAAGSLETVHIDCDSSWNVTTTDSWITLSYSSGIGNFDLSITIDPNTSTSFRTGTLNFSRGSYHAIVSINQTGVDTLLTFDSDSLFVPSNGMVTDYAVNSNVAFAIVSDQVWVNSGATTATGNYTGELTITNNSTTVIRQAQLIISAGSFSDTLYILQDSSSYFLTTDTDTLFFNWNDTPKFVEVTTNSSWSLIPSESWVTTDIAFGTGNDSVQVNAENNLGLTRYALLDISNGLISKSVTIVQYANSAGISHPEGMIFTVYPNPFENKLNIHASGNAPIEEVALFSANGILLQHFSFGGMSAVQITTPENLAPGIYLLQINGSETVRIVR